MPNFRSILPKTLRLALLRHALTIYCAIGAAWLCLMYATGAFEQTTFFLTMSFFFLGYILAICLRDLGDVASPEDDVRREFLKMGRVYGVLPSFSVGKASVCSGPGGIIVLVPYFAPGVVDTNFNVLIDSGPNKREVSLPVKEDMFVLRDALSSLAPQEVPVYYLALFHGSTILNFNRDKNPFLCMTLRDNLYPFWLFYGKKSIDQAITAATCKSMEEGLRETIKTA